CTSLHIFTSSPFSSYPLPPDLHSFPTRRSSDLQHRVLADPHVVAQDDAGQEGGPVPDRAVATGDDERPDRDVPPETRPLPQHGLDRKSTRLNSSHGSISYAVFCLKKKNTHNYTN